jgi:hypothetical protein
MAVFTPLRFASAIALLAVVGDATVYLSPDQDVVLPASGSASNPLEWLGANGPYFAGEIFRPFEIRETERAADGEQDPMSMESTTRCQITATLSRWPTL